MKQKPVLYTEFFYLFGIVALALGAALLVRADFGVSVVVSPAYLLHLFFSQTTPAFTFGVAEYVMQGVLLLLLMVLVRRFHWSYLVSFATALFYGLALDGFLSLLPVLGHTQLRLLCFVIGLFFCASGVSFIFHTYLSPEVYELLIREISLLYGFPIGKVKTAYDCISCCVATGMSFLFFGLFHLRGVGIGTLISALFSGSLVAFLSRQLESHFTLKPAFPKLAHLFTPPPFPARASKNATSKV